ncbi:MAG: RluA family pseudouridine synthase [Bacteroidales bacterium]|nr:RluA family pseudouridine synthase [Bacteroidales bacterium]
MINNPYIYHPHPLLRVAADDICFYIEQHPQWAQLFEQGKMLGAMLCEDGTILKAYSGVVNGLEDPEHYFVPPVYDLANPDDFYLQEDEEISNINKQINELQGIDNPKTRVLKEKRKELSQNLQLKIFSHFNFVSTSQSGTYRNILDIFTDAKRSLPPGGSGECAAPRLWQYAIEHNLKPIALAEFWFGQSPRKIRRVHRQFYPSCIEKCSPILAYFMQDQGKATEAEPSHGAPVIIYENDHLVVIEKPSGLLSSPAKDLRQPNVEAWLKQHHPECKLPNMLAHRLDQATSGILVAAKDAQTHKWLQQGFEQRQFHKSYIAWLEGYLPSNCGIINLPICVNPDDRPRQTVDWQFGKNAITRYRVIERKENRTLVEFMPITGRTHQLRLHAASPFGLDHPIIGDTLYNLEQSPSVSSRLMLHAQSIILSNELQWQKNPSW